MKIRLREEEEERLNLKAWKGFQPGSSVAFKLAQPPIKLEMWTDGAGIKLSSLNITFPVKCVSQILHLSITLGCSWWFHMYAVIVFHQHCCHISEVHGRGKQLGADVILICFLIQFNLGSIWIQFSQPASMCKCTAQLNITGEINFAMLPSIGYHTLQWGAGPTSWTRAGEIEKSSGANVVSRVICRKVDFMKCNFVWCESSQVVEECSRVVCIWCTERGREWGVGRRVRGESGGGGRVIKRRPVSTNSFSGKGPHWLDRPTQPICNCEIKYTADKLLSSHSSHLATALPRNMSFLLSL